MGEDPLMDITPDPDGLIRRDRHIRDGGDDPELRRAERQGRLVRVTRGVYRPVVDDEHTADPGADKAYRNLVVAVAGRSRERVVSHQSAAAIHRLKLLRPDQRLVHFYVPAGGRRGREVHLHEGALTWADVTVVDGVLLTKLANGTRPRSAPRCRTV
jgi:predicted transcriptional regulator of viral defense system